MLYQNYETEISKKNLRKVFAQIPEPLCLLGGWAIFLTVNQNFRNEHGQEYHGSKDIDLGFHIDDKITDFKETTFYKAIKVLEKIGFIPVSQRYVKFYTEDGRELTEEQSKKFAQPFLFNLYVDPIVDRVTKDVVKSIGYTPIDEPLLLEAFDNGRYKNIDAFGAKMMLPNPELLLATKINAVLNRTKDHKRIKDIADIFALIAYSGKGRKEMLTDVKTILRIEKIRKVFVAFSDEDLKRSAEALGIDSQFLSTIMKGFIANIETKAVESVDTPRETDDIKWRIPFNISYESYLLILKALFQQKADSQQVSLEDLIRVTGLNRSTLVGNAAFLKSVGVLETDSKDGYKLTSSVGKKYAKAVYTNNSALVSEASKEIIEGSHLKGLLDFIKLKERKIDEIYGYIKGEGRFADGPGISGMTNPYAAGAKTLLRIFRDAELLPEGIDVDVKKETQSTQNKQKSTTERPRRKSKQRMESEVESNTDVEKTGDSYGRIVIKGIGTVEINDVDTLELAESFLKLLRKKIVQNDNESPSQNNIMQDP